MLTSRRGCDTRKIQVVGADFDALFVNILGYLRLCELSCPMYFLLFKNFFCLFFDYDSKMFSILIQSAL